MSVEAVVQVELRPITEFSSDQFKSIELLDTMVNAAKHREMLLSADHSYGIVARGVLIGDINLSTAPEDKRLGVVSYWVAASQRGHGFATSALKQIVDAEQRKGEYDRIGFAIFDSNEPSQKIAARIGARIVDIDSILPGINFWELRI